MSETHAGPSLKATSPIDDSQLSANIPRLDAVVNNFSGDISCNKISANIFSTVIDISGRVTHVNVGTPPNVPVPSQIAGYAVNRGDIAGVLRDYAGVYWDESVTRWKFAINTGADDITLGVYSDLQVNNLYSNSVSGDGSSLTGLTPGQVGADSAGAASTVQGNLNTHAALVGASAHGLGTSSTHAATDFETAGAAAVVQGNLTSHTGNTSNPHSVTKTQVGLSNVPNTDCTVATNISSGTLADARLSANVVLASAQTIQNIIHVAANGTDTRSGLNKYSLFSPFATYQAAINASASGDQIWGHLLSTERNVALKTGVNMHFDVGCGILTTRNAGSDFAIGDNGAAVVCSITGFGTFEITDATLLDTFGFVVSNAGSNIFLQCISVTGTGNGIRITAGALKSRCDAYAKNRGISQSGGTLDHVGKATGTAATGTGSQCFSGTQIIKGDVSGGSTCGAQCLAGANQTVYGNVSSTDGSGIQNDGGTQRIVSGRITNAAYYGAAIYNGGITTLENCTVTAGGGKEAVDFEGTAAVLVARNTKFIPDGAATTAFVRGSGAGAHAARVSHSCSTKTMLSTGITNPITGPNNIEDVNV